MKDEDSNHTTKRLQSKQKSRASKETLPNQTFGITPPLLDCKQAGCYLGLSDWTIRDLISSGKLQTVKIPHPWKDGKFIDRQLLDIKDLEKFVELLKSKET